MSKRFEWAKSSFGGPPPWSSSVDCGESMDSNSRRKPHCVSCYFELLGTEESYCRNCGKDVLLVCPNAECGTFVYRSDRFCYSCGIQVVKCYEWNEVVACLDTLVTTTAVVVTVCLVISIMGRLTS